MVKNVKQRTRTTTIVVLYAVKILPCTVYVTTSLSHKSVAPTDASRVHPITILYRLESSI
jgi:hypothetical protein